jgi:hypothetical protein
VFWKLKQLQAGDEVAIARSDGSTAIFRVDRSQNFKQDKFPTQEVYGDIPYAGLRLVTCSGTYSRTQGHYSDNLVVFATLKSIEK